MFVNHKPPLKISLLIGLMLTGCSSHRQVTVDYPGADSGASGAAQSTKTESFQTLPGFHSIDGDDFYIRLNSEFKNKGENNLKSGCSSLAPNFKHSDFSSALIFTVKNNRLKFNNETAGYSYQVSTGNCNVKFEAKKQVLTPWMRLDAGKDTSVDYSFYSSENSDVDVAGIVNKTTAAGNLLAFTGVGMGVAVLGQFAGQWLGANQQTQVSPTSVPTYNRNTQSHSLPAFVSYSNHTGTLVETVFKLNAVAEGGLNILGTGTQVVGELRVYPELTSSLLLKTGADGLPDARDLSLSEILYTPVKSAGGDINLQQLVEQSKHPEKPNLTPDWKNYDDVQTNCRKLKLALKDLGFNKFDRDALLYYFLSNTPDWKNYNIPPAKAQSDNLSAKTLKNLRAKNFDQCLAADDFVVMRTMGLVVNTDAEWSQMGDSSEKKEQFFQPLKAVERQLVAVIKNPNPAEMESQIFPLLNTAKSGDGTVLLQNHLGDFGLEKLIQLPSAGSATPEPSAPSLTPIPGEGSIVNAKQLVQVFTGLMIQEMSCARIAPDQLGKAAADIGIVLFTTREGSPRAKGGAIEFEFSGGKIHRIAFQSPAYRDFEQDIAEHPDVGDCRIDPAFPAKLH